MLALLVAANIPARTRWILVYAGGPRRPAYSVDDFRHLITAVDSSGRSTGWLMTGTLFLELYSPSGRAFATWAYHPAANGADWQAYLDSLLSPGAVISRLDSAVGVASQAVGPLGHPFPVVVMIPYPDPAVDTVRFQNTVYSMSVPAQRLGLVQAYIGVVRSRFLAAGYRNLALTGFYWLNEKIEAQDRAFVPTVASAVHQAGFQFLWIPYYLSSGHDAWKGMGFDEAWYQPNYFFHPQVSALRVDSAMGAAESMGMGIELEFDLRLLNNSTYADRLTPYLDALRVHPVLRRRGIALYDGGGGLLTLSRSMVPRDVTLYHNFVTALTGQ